MTDSERDEVFTRLVSFLRSRRLGWVAEAVQSEIEEGMEKTGVVRTFEEKLNPTTERSELTLNRKGAVAEIFVPFTASERLHCLINAIEAVAVETVFMQQTTLNTLRAVAEPIQERVADQRMTIRFDSSDSGDTVHEFGQSDLEDRVRSATELRELLNALRAEI